MKEYFQPTFSVKFCERHQSPAMVQSRQEQTCFDLLKAVVAMGGIIAKVKMACGCRLTYFGSDAYSRTLQERARAESGAHDSPPEPRRSATLNGCKKDLPGQTHLFPPKMRYEE